MNDQMIWAGLLIVKLTLLVTVLWAFHGALRERNPRWQVCIWRAGMLGVMATVGASLASPIYQWKFDLTAKPNSPGLAEVNIQEAEFNLDSDPAPEISSDFLLGSRTNHVETGPTDSTRTLPNFDSSLDSIDQSSHSLTSLQNNSPQGNPLSQRNLRLANDQIVADTDSTTIDTPSLAWIDGRLLRWSIIAAWLVWLCGAIVLLTRYVVGCWQVRKLVRQSVEVDGVASVWVAAFADRLSLRKSSVRVSSSVDSPVLVGMFRPVILLPRTLLSLERATEAQAAIAHELVHISNHDLLWDGLVRLVSCFCWPHPLYWNIISAHRLACDRVCDALASQLVGDRESYRRSLANLALEGARLSASVPGLAMARPSDIVLRLRQLGGNVSAVALGKKKWALGGFLLLVALTLGAGSVVTAAKRALPQSNLTAEQLSQEDEAPKSLKLTVVDENDQPLPDCKVVFEYYANTQQPVPVKTGSDGSVIFEYLKQETVPSLRVYIYHAGNEPYLWVLDEGPIAAWPESKTIHLRPGKKVGGVVVDGKGKPVSGVNVAISADADEATRHTVYRIVTLTTGDDGRWQTDLSIEPRKYSLALTHPDYFRTLSPIFAGLEHQYVLKPGLSVSGFVRDTEGNPIPDCTLIFGLGRRGHPDERQGTTDAQGRYEVKAIHDDCKIVTVNAPFHSPQIKPLNFDKNGVAICDFILEKGRTIVIKVVNEKDEPQSGIGVAASEWRELTTIDWRTKTNADGTAIWHGAPSDEVKIDFYSMMYRSNRRVSFRAGEDVQTVVMLKPLMFRGSVINAVTKKAVPEFTVGFGTKMKDQDAGIYWVEYQNKKCRDGELQQRIDETSEEYDLFLRIESEGYETWVSEAIDVSENPQLLDVPLQPHAAASGMVLTAGGKAALGAEVYVGKDQLRFERGIRPMGFIEKVVTDGDGRFQLKPLDGSPEKATVAIVHESGFIELPWTELADRQQINLEDWASLEVQFLHGDQPVTNSKIAFHCYDQSGQFGRIKYWMAEETTDENGIARFEKVPPTSNGFVAEVLERGFSSSFSRSTKIELKPGENTKITLGGSGSSIVGQIQLPPNPPKPHSWKTNPVGWLSCIKSDDGQSDGRGYCFFVGENGQFKIDDIPPGTYRMNVNLTADGQNPNEMGRAELDSIVHSEIGEAATDLGTIMAVWNQPKIPVGTACPDFVARAMDDSIVSLNDFRGKFLVLGFGGTWGNQLTQNALVLSDFQKQFKDQPDVRVVMADFDEDFEKAKAVFGGKDYSIELIYGDRNYSGMLAHTLGIESTDEFLLVGRDGKVLYRGESLPELGDILQRELKQKLPENIVPVSRIKSEKIADDFAGEGRKVAFALRVGTSTSPTKSAAGLYLFDQEAKQIRHLDDLPFEGWSKRIDAMTFDQKRGRIYVCDASGNRLVALDRNGRMLFQTPINSIQTIAVDDANGDIWCTCSRTIQTGWTVVLDSDGNEKYKIPESGTTVRYSNVNQAFWYTGKKAALVDHSGKVLFQDPIRSDAFSYTATVVDKTGACWTLEDTHPSVAGSEERLWRFTHRSRKLIEKYPSDKQQDTNSNYATQVGTVTRQVDIVDDEVWVAASDTSPGWNKAEKRMDASKTRFFTLRYDLDGKPLGVSEGYRVVTQGSDGTIWRILFDGTVVRTSPTGEELRVDTPLKLEPGAFQSMILGSF